jgi:hypothetical protein
VSLASVFARRVSSSDMLSGIRKMMLKVLSFLEQTAARLVRRPNVDGFTVLSLTASSRTMFLARSGTGSMRRRLSSTRINLAEVMRFQKFLEDSSFSDGKKARAELMSRKGLRTAVSALTTSFSWLRLLPLHAHFNLNKLKSTRYRTVCVYLPVYFAALTSTTGQKFGSRYLDYLFQKHIETVVDED